MCIFSLSFFSFQHFLSCGIFQFEEKMNEKRKTQFSLKMLYNPHFYMKNVFDNFFENNIFQKTPFIEKHFLIDEKHF